MNPEVDQFFSEQADSYDRVPWQRDAVFYRTLLDVITSWCKPPFLELGCASGNLLQHIASTGALAIGIDVNHAMCINTKRKLSVNRIASYVLQADALDLPFDDQSFGCVVSRNALHHIARFREVGREVQRVVTRPGHWLIVECVAPDRAAREWREIFELKDIGRCFWYTHAELQNTFAECSMGKLVFNSVYVCRGNNVRDWVIFSGRPNWVYDSIWNYYCAIPQAVRENLGLCERHGELYLDKLFSILLYRYG